MANIVAVNANVIAFLVVSVFTSFPKSIKRLNLLAFFTLLQSVFNQLKTLNTPVAFWISKPLSIQVKLARPAKFGRFQSTHDVPFSLKGHCG